MSEAPFRLVVLDEEYVEIRDPEELVWPGTLMYFPHPPERDVKCYMLVRDDAGLRFVNWLGFKAGATLILASIPPEAVEKGAHAPRLGWFRDNWHKEFLPFGSFETTRFLVWERSLDRN